MYRKVTYRVLPVPILDDFEGGAPLDDEDADATPDAGCQRVRIFTTTRQKSGSANT